MSHFICEVYRDGDYVITTPDNVVVKRGTCKELVHEKDGDKMVVKPNVAWAALMALFVETEGV
jgi:hypothetical protein